MHYKELSDPGHALSLKNYFFHYLAFVSGNNYKIKINKLNCSFFIENMLHIEGSDAYS
jgi:hypothetical protein